MNERLPLCHHRLSSPSAFRPEALVEAVRTERGIEAASVPEICVLDFDDDLTDWLVKTGIAHPHPAWACFHTTMYSFEVGGIQCGIVARTIGGPYAVLVAEQLHVSGVRVLLGLTSAGQPLLHFLCQVWWSQPAPFGMKELPTTTCPLRILSPHPRSWRPIFTKGCKGWSFQLRKGLFGQRTHPIAKRRRN